MRRESPRDLANAKPLTPDHRRCSRLFSLRAPVSLRRRLGLINELDAADGLQADNVKALRRGFLASTSCQNSFAGLSLIDSKVLREWRISASRSGLKLQRSSFRGNPRSGDRSFIFVPSHHSFVSFMSFSGDRSVTFVTPQRRI